MNPHEIIKVAVVDDDPEIIRIIRQGVDGQKAMQWAGSAGDGMLGVQFLRSNPVDIALIDIVMPCYDGFFVLEELSRQHEDKPLCIMLSGMGQSHNISRAAKLGANHFILKPFDMDLLFKRISDIWLECAPTRFTGNPVQQKPDDYVHDILQNLHISQALLGYEYIKTAVSIITADQTALHGITKRLYPEVAKRHKTTATRVERSIRHAIQVLWKRDGGAKFYKLMGLSDTIPEKPTNGHFIAMIADRYINLYSE